MKSPKLYTIRKITLKEIIDNKNNFKIPYNKRKIYNIKQSDNMLFRQVRLITNDYRDFNKYIVFVDCKGWKSREKELKEILKNGFYLNSIKFLPTEKSSSMSRNATMGFVDASIKKELDKRISMDMEIETTVLAKLLAYRGLLFSGCFCLEDWYPYIIVVDDYSKVLPNQHIKYLIDVEKEVVNKKTGESFIWKEKGINTAHRDVSINLWDGSGIHSPNITKQVKEKIQSEENPTSILWRFPYSKGMTHEVDFKLWFKEHGVKTIVDVFKKEHNIEDVDIIVTKSFYKGYKYFQKYKDYRDWELYWRKFKKYNHCIGVAAWNYSFENEPRMKKASYQILQDLEMDFEDFIELADDTKEWVDNIINGDKIYTYCFLGLFADHIKTSNDYMRAILKNPEMLKEECIRNYFIELLKKNIDLMKCGKIYLNGSFRFVVTDLVMFLEYISGKEVKGVLKENEFYSKGYNGVDLGERIIERNPHISQEEHLILNGIDNPLIKKYCSHLSNVCQLNGYSLALPRLNGADEDGDRVFVINNEIMKSGIQRDLPIVIDIDDKITALEEEITDDGVIECTVRSMVSLVGEISNYATCYHNKTPKTDEQKKKYLEYINILSICNGKSIDFAKTGVIFYVPKHITKYSKPLPYFMKYASDYYKTLKKLSKAHSNLNRLAWDIEKWSKQIRYKRKFKDFDYNIMIDNSIPRDDEKFNRIEALYSDFEQEMKGLRIQNAMQNNYDMYQDYFDGLTKDEVINSKINWKYYYQKYRDMAREICPDQQELANYIVEICYGKYSKKNKKFIWTIAGEGVVKNIKQLPVIRLPIEDENGEYEYLGYKYSLRDVRVIAE